MFDLKSEPRAPGAKPDVAAVSGRVCTRRRAGSARWVAGRVRGRAPTVTADGATRPLRRQRKWRPTAETGLRTNEWTAPERREIDWRGERPAVVVQRRYSDGVLTDYPRTDRRRVVLSDRALAALGRLTPGLDTPLLLPASEGGHIDHWRLRKWYPALDAAGITRRGPYKRAAHVRHGSARWWHIDLPARARDGNQREDDRQDLRTSGTGLRSRSWWC